ncbi:MAG: hypothetical protein KBD24_03595 [Candidatus Pacebacteria bacterium]|nr:hypothetical protein [Candidatus Paceibacterota bacterium]
MGTTLVLQGGQRTQLSTIATTLKVAGIDPVEITDEGATMFARRLRLHGTMVGNDDVRGAASMAFEKMGINAMFY